MLSIVILAAGQGKRMQSNLPKVLHKLAGKSLLEHVYKSACRLEYREIYIVYGFGGTVVRDSLPHLHASWVEQAEQLGTGHAVKLAIPTIPDEDDVLVLFGDVPLISSESLHRLTIAAGHTGISLLTSIIDNPTGYGRIIRDAAGKVLSIIEERDATEGQKAINEINTGMMVVKARLLKTWLAELGNSNAQGEYYLTDIIAKATSASISVNTVHPDSVLEINGINDRAQLAEVERHYQLTQAKKLMQQGLSLLDPARFDLRGQLQIGRDVCIDINAIIEGNVSLGDNVLIGPNCYIKDTAINAGTTILANSIIDNAVIGSNCRIGPFARIRPDTRLDDHVHIGNFVEIKKSDVGKGSKINHLSYIGDSDIGMNVNIGAGTITCNYDGVNKYKTTVGDNVFIGSDSQLIAPVVVGNRAMIGAGTTVTRDIAPDTLTYSKVEHKIIDNWKRPDKKK